MEQRTDRLNPSAPYEKKIKNIDLKQRLERKLNDVNSSFHHISNKKELITDFKNKNDKSKKN